MHPSTIPSPTIPSPSTTSADEDLADQARPGYGIPSQDPRAGAQTALEPEDAEREAHSVLVGGGMMAGAAAGAAVGVAVAGPVGVVVGGTLGGIAGALGGAAAGTAVNTEDAGQAADPTAAAIRTEPRAADKGDRSDQTPRSGLTCGPPAVDAAP